MIAGSPPHRATMLRSGSAPRSGGTTCRFDLGIRLPHQEVNSAEGGGIEPEALASPHGRPRTGRAPARDRPPDEQPMCAKHIAVPVRVEGTVAGLLRGA